VTDSPQQRQHWLAEEALNLSGLPVMHVRRTVFPQNPFFSAFFEPLLTMVHLHAASRYDRLTHDVQTITGRLARSIHDFVGAARRARVTGGSIDSRDHDG
jgi:hypothetical protein